MQIKLDLPLDEFAFVGFTEDELPSGGSGEGYSDDPLETPAGEPEAPPATSVRNPEQLLKLYKELQAKNKQTERQLKAFGGLTPQEISDLRKARDDAQAEKAAAEETRLKTEGQYAKLYENKLTQETEKFQKEINLKEKRIKTLEEQLAARETEIGGIKTQIKTKTLRDSVADTFFSNGGKRGDAEVGANDYFDTLWSRYQGRFNLAEDGKTLEILDESGSEIAVDADGKPLTLKGFMNQVKTKGAMRYLFDGITPSGNDTPPGGKRPRVTTPVQGEVRVINPKDLSRLSALGISLEDINQGKVLVRPDAPPAR